MEDADSSYEWKSTSESSLDHQAAAAAAAGGGAGNVPFMLQMHGAKPTKKPSAASSGGTSSDAPTEKGGGDFDMASMRAFMAAKKQEETKRGANFYADSPKRGVAAKTKPLPPEPAPDSPPKESTDFEDGVSETEVEKYALHLGMDPKEDEQFLWIAEQALLAPLPPQWCEVLTENGATAFKNTLTGVVTWTHPLEDQFRSMFFYHKSLVKQEAAQAAMANAEGHVSQEASPQKADDDGDGASDDSGSRFSSLNHTRGRLMLSGVLEDEMELAGKALEACTLENKPPPARPAKSKAPMQAVPGLYNAVPVSSMDHGAGASAAAGIAAALARVAPPATAKAVNLEVDLDRTLNGTPLPPNNQLPPNKLRPPRIARPGSVQGPRPSTSAGVMNRPDLKPIHMDDQLRASFDAFVNANPVNHFPAVPSPPLAARPASRGGPAARPGSRAGGPRPGSRGGGAGLAPVVAFNGPPAAASGASAAPHHEPQVWQNPSAVQEPHVWTNPNAGPASTQSRPGSVSGSRPGSVSGSRPGSVSGSRPSSSGGLTNNAVGPPPTAPGRTNLFRPDVSMIKEDESFRGLQQQLKAARRGQQVPDSVAEGESVSDGEARLRKMQAVLRTLQDGLRIMQTMPTARPQTAAADSSAPHSTHNMPAVHKSPPTGHMARPMTSDSGTGYWSPAGLRAQGATTTASTTTLPSVHQTPPSSQQRPSTSAGVHPAGSRKPGIQLSAVGSSGAGVGSRPGSRQTGSRPISRGGYQ